MPKYISGMIEKVRKLRIWLWFISHPFKAVLCIVGAVVTLLLFCTVLLRNFPCFRSGIVNVMSGPSNQSLVSPTGIN